MKWKCFALQIYSHSIKQLIHRMDTLAKDFNSNLTLQLCDVVILNQNILKKEIQVGQDEK